ncbi:hypothetical protein P7K49_025752 [Saguinus oedipus]|uniref:C-type lectin domain-containing protein n=1 Tax=Saguinus oedipus TaxID=9490 RepID=A0ABQ9UI29_SAGOE|nr:hypothetical protein P7K49_025752 [Saguinus oedipus]
MKGWCPVLREYMTGACDLKTKVNKAACAFQKNIQEKPPAVPGGATGALLRTPGDACERLGRKCETLESSYVLDKDQKLLVQGGEHGTHTHRLRPQTRGRRQGQGAQRKSQLQGKERNGVAGARQGREGPEGKGERATRPGAVTEGQDPLEVAGSIKAHLNHPFEQEEEWWCCSTSRQMTLQRDQADDTGCHWLEQIPLDWLAGILWEPWGTYTAQVSPTRVQGSDQLTFLLQDLLSRYPVSKHSWVGARRGPQGWHWIDGAPLPSQLLPKDGENNSDINCGALEEGTLVAANCSTPRPWVCAKGTQ